jgi:eukaryotic-like serine/threonine-protein kinase
MNFLKYESPEYKLKIDFPATWEKMDDKTVLPPSFVIWFASPFEVPLDSYRESVGVSVSVVDKTFTSLKECIDNYIDNIKKTFSDSAVLDSLPTTIAGLSAYQMVYIGEHGIKISAVVTTKENKVYAIMYFAKPEKYQEYLSTVEQMIASFEFLS